jgi:group I intron endonuclease
MNSGIYCIENLINGKKYIGSASSLFARKSDHFYCLKNNKHNNTHLQRAYNKYGHENFIFKILIICEIFELKKYEQFFVDFYKPEIYNICLKCVDSRFGVKASIKTRKRIIKNHADISGENHPMYGKHRSEETKKKLSEINKGQNNPNYGIPKSKETKEKISIGNKGKHRSEETRRRLSESLKEYWRKKHEENKEIINSST